MLLRIQLLTSGKFLVLNTGGALTVEVHTTLFNSRSDFFGSFAYPLGMPLDPNRAALQNAHYIATDSKKRTVDIMLWLGSLPYKQCKMTFTIENDTVQANCYIDTTLITARMRDLQLTGLSIPGVSTQVSFASPADLQAYMKSTTTAAPGSLPVVFFPFRDDGAYKVVDGSANAIYYRGTWNASTNTPVLHNDATTGIRPIGAVVGWCYKVVAGTSFDFGSGAQSCVTDQFVVFDGHAWRPTANGYGYFIVGQGNDVCFPLEPVVNRWEMDALGNAAFKIDPSTGPYNQTQAPAVLLTWLIKRILAFFNLKPIGKFLDEEYANRLVIWSRVTVTKTLIIEDFINYLPAISVADAIKEIRTLYGIMIDPDMTRGVCLVESLANLEQTAEVIDLRDCQVRSFREIANTTTYYTIMQSADPDDAAFVPGDILPELQVGDSSRAVTNTGIPMISVQTKMTTELAATDALLTTPVVANWRIPHIKQAVYTAAPMDPVVSVSTADRNNFKLRMLYYHGMVPNAGGYLYPYASSDNLDVNGNPLTNINLSLVPAPTDFSPLQRYFNFMLNSKPFEMGFLLTPRQVFNIQAKNRILVKDPFSFNTVSCILDQMAADLRPNQQTIEAKITLYPKILPNNARQIAPTVVAPPVTPPVDNGVVFVRINVRNVNPYSVTFPTPATGHHADIFVEFFADSAAATPKNVTALDVRFKVELVEDGTTTVSTSFITVNCTSTTNESELEHQADTDEVTGGHSYDWTYTLLSSPYYTMI